MGVIVHRIFKKLTFGSTVITHCAGRCEAMWVTISHGNDNKPLASGEGEELTSAEVG